MRLFALADRTLDDILASVSRSFYLSLAALPAKVRAQVSLAYLIARAADTIADTKALPSDARYELLLELKGAIQDPKRVVTAVGEIQRAMGFAADPSVPAGERVLLERLGDCLRKLHALEDADRARTQRVLTTLAIGMERDLQRFPEGAPLAALATFAALDEHCYYAAGCVGEYWTNMTAAHASGMARLRRPDFVARGVRLGKALQMVNVLRDAPRDLADGRCYWPAELLAAHDIAPTELRALIMQQSPRIEPVLAALKKITLDHVDAAFAYVLAIPPYHVRLRLSALWPLWIALATLEHVRAEKLYADGKPAKITRGQVYKLIAESSAVAPIDALLKRAHAERRARAA